MDYLEREFDHTAVGILNLLNTVGSSHPNLVVDIKALVQSLYTIFIQAVNKVKNEGRVGGRWTKAAETHLSFSLSLSLSLSLSFFLFLFLFFSLSLCHLLVCLPFFLSFFFSLFLSLRVLSSISFIGFIECLYESVSLVSVSLSVYGPVLSSESLTVSHSLPLSFSLSLAIF